MIPDWIGTPQPVPYAAFNDPQTLNLYAYVRDNPLARADLDGHTDYYRNDGHPLGSDGINNGVVVVTRMREVPKVAGVVTAPAVQEQYRIEPGIGKAIQASVQRSDRPSINKQGSDSKGGRHEEGFTVDSKGIHAAPPGPAANPSDKEAHINLLVGADTSVVEHVHPAGSTATFGGGQFQQTPSGVDLANTAAAPFADMYIVVGAQTNTVYFYDANGVTAQVPLSAFAPAPVSGH